MCKAPKEDEFRGAESTGSAKGMLAGANLFGLINAVLTDLFMLKTPRAVHFKRQNAAH